MNELILAMLIIGTTHISNTFAYRSTTSSNSGTQTPKHFPFHSCWQSHLYPLSQCSSWGSIASTLTQKSLECIQISNKNIMYLQRILILEIKWIWIDFETYQLLQSQHPKSLQIPSTIFVWVKAIRKIPTPIINNEIYFIFRIQVILDLLSNRLFV